MWAAEISEGDVALDENCSRQFFRRECSRSRGRATGNYQNPESMRSRIDSSVITYLYGTESGGQEDGKESGSTVFAAKWNGTAGIWSIPVPHGVDRIEPLGGDSVVIGSDGKDLLFTTLQLKEAPTAMDRYVFRGGSQGETRSHGFFYKPDSGTSGILGLPVLSPDQYATGSASMIFLESKSLHLTPIGELRSNPVRTADDGCKASCVDWYGNARPLFLRGRIFALLGYEIVEGRLDAGAIKEVRRTNFAPGENIARSVE